MLWSTLGLPAWAQFKKVFEPDTAILHPPSFFTAIKVVETDLPGRELFVTGTIITQDSGGAYRIAAYTLLTNLHGEPQAMHIFEDTSQFVFQGPKAYGACYGGNGELYMGVGTNNKQVILKSTASGQLLWAKAANHHEFYSLLCEGNTMVSLGQDESIQGAHDFSLQRLNASDGSFQLGKMFGTTGFENPQKVARIGMDYLMVGSSFQTSNFDLMVVRADSGFNTVWGKTYTIPNKTTVGYAIGKPREGSGYVVTGGMRGGVDTLFVLRLDAAGNPLWARHYAIAGATEATNYVMVVDPESGGYLLAGAYRATGYLRPFVFMTDSVGNVQWARDYGEPGVDTDEFLNDVIYCHADGFFYGVGDRVEVDSNNFWHKVFAIKIAADSGTVPCDSALAVTSGPLAFQAGLTTFEEPFLSNADYPIGNLFPVRMNVETRCSIIAGIQDVPLTGIFQLENPSTGELHLKVEVPWGGGTLQVMSLRGECVWESRLEEGLQQVSHSLSQLSAGLYLVTVQGEGWRYPARRWAVQR